MSNVAIVSLFKKLVDNDLNELFEKKSKKFSTLVELQNSIIEDLSCLLNTRVADYWSSHISKITIPYCYGVNVTAPTSSESVFEIQQLEARIDNAIKRFETRLIDAKSQVINVENASSTLFINIEAIVICGDYKIPLSFPVTIDV